ncbi:TonB-dependent receptor [Sulfurimonas xiamenensis]|jgi:iron complex outermembrane receptor protein|uniref:TonB-dependent receptor n=1 Tax=Sulfurimonas xiamenensis TaxID=2590021 RepID=A0AAJ4DLZ5_9BACT|nr:TonB-dependent receptor [Sulfurimonas xiamenensis]QFR42667.1 TonB-dependent receptor [Sulfurimonas xiamenensis]
MYKKIIPLSLTVVAVLNASEIQLPKISIESTTITEVSQEAQLSADLAQALSSSVPSIDMNRRSGIANDIYIRGQKRDNISVDVDGTKIFGACPNRMDPPTSHIVTSQIEDIEVIEGPYDVENFGTLSGGLKITTKEPTKDLSGEVTFGVGSWNYRKVGATVSGGNDFIRVLISGSSESSDQYEDGDGNTLAEQTNLKATTPFKYQSQYEDMEAYKKKSLMAKAYITVTDDQELRLSMTNNRSDDVLYPNSKMDAAYDYSNIYSIAYDVQNISDIYKNLNLKYYYSDVDHPMDTRYRNTAATNGWYRTNHLKTTMQGLKLKNSFDVYGYNLLFGLDGSRRTWEGKYYNTTVATGAVIPASISTSLTHTETENMAAFAKVEKTFGDFDIEAGARLDDTEITPDDVSKRKRDYDAISANLLTTYNLNETNKIFLGVGQASRVPDPRELYLVSPSGNEDLEQTTNTEVDLGYELNNNMMNFKVKAFYSMLEDYIYFNKTANTFNNIDATVYGAELSTSIYATDALTVDMKASYKVGEKDDVAPGADEDLADIAPLRGDIALNYEYMTNSVATLEVQASDKWDDFDADSGEQELDSWAIVNLKVKHAVNKNFDFTLGVNNLFDETYALSNTYADLILLTTGSTDTMLLNEPGRYIYTNLTFKF